MASRTQRTFRFKDEILEELDELAEKENRSSNNMAEILMAEALKARKEPK